MAMLEISHTREGGTLIEGTARGDGSSEVLKGLRWRWSRGLGMWFVPRSRDCAVDVHLVERTMQALRSAGFEVSVVVDDAPRPVEVVERDRSERAQARAQAMEAKAQRREATAEQAWARHERAVAQLPPGGEPVKVGHHSEGRHRRALERSWSSLGSAVHASNEAQEAQRRAEVAAHTDAVRSAPLTVARRIERLEADRGRVARALAEATAPARVERLSAQLDELVEQLDYWGSIRRQQLEDGQAPGFGPADVEVGARVRRGASQWLTVLRVNSKTVTVAPRFEGFPNARVPYFEIQQVIPAEEVRRAEASAQ